MKTTTNATTTTSSTKLFACSIALAVALAAGSLATAIAPSTALANDGMEAPSQPAAVQYQGRYEGQQVTIGDDWGQPVYAEWHQDGAGVWWATFLTYNGTTVYAQPAPAGCGWAFHAYDKNGVFTTIFRTNESSDYGVFGPKGVSSHWQDDNGYWY